MKLALYCVPLFMSFILPGCGMDSEETKENDTKQENTEQTTNSYKMVVFDYAPFAFKDADETSIGYDVDLMTAIAKEANISIKIHYVPFNSLFNSLANGEYDVAMSGLTLTDDRKERFLSKAYAANKTGYLVKEDSSYTEAKDLSNQRISVLDNSFQHEELLKTPESQPIVEQTMFLVYQAVMTGKSEAALSEEPPLLYESEQFSENPVRFISFSDKLDNYAIYVNSEQKELMEKINQGLDTIIKNGKYQEINKKWFGEHANEVSIIDNPLAS